MGRSAVESKRVRRCGKVVLTRVPGQESDTAVDCGVGAS